MAAQFSALTDQDLIIEVQRLATCERAATGAVIRGLMELDSRRLYLGEGYPSLFTYCTRVLNYSAQAAFNRIEIARAARRHPQLLELVTSGAIHLSGARVLAPHLTDENCAELLGQATHKSKREIEEIVASLQPTPEFALLRSWICAVGPGVYRVHFTMGRETHERLRRVQDLLRQVVPNGDPAVIFDRALAVLLADLERGRLGATSKPRPSKAIKAGSRHISPAVRRGVWERDGGQCAFVGDRGRCPERGWLEFHHVVPFAAGGAATLENIELRCRAHNAYEATRYFGAGGADMVRERAPAWGEDAAPRTLPVDNKGVIYGCQLTAGP
jgi:hypothetical protein